MAIIADDDMEIILKGSQEKVIRNMLDNRLFCLIKMPAQKPDRCISKCSSSVFVGFMNGMDRSFAIRKEGSKTVYEKCEYYLKNDDVRKRIARAGYETVKKKYNYPLLLSRAFELSGLKESLELM